MVMQGKTQGLYWFGPSVPTSSSSFHVLALVCSRGYKWAREETSSQVSVLHGCRAGYRASSARYSSARLAKKLEPARLAREPNHKNTVQGDL